MKKNDLNDLLEQERKIYLSDSWKQRLIDSFLKRERFLIWHFVKTMRYCEYYGSNKHKSVFHALMYLYYMRKHNSNCVTMGGQIAPGTLGAATIIYHINGNVVNGYSKIGINCTLVSLNIC